MKSIKFSFALLVLGLLTPVYGRIIFDSFSWATDARGALTFVVVSFSLLGSILAYIESRG
jgi:hypothetical protein